MINEVEEDIGCEIKELVEHGNPHSNDLAGKLFTLTEGLVFRIAQTYLMNRQDAERGEAVEQAEIVVSEFGKDLFDPNKALFFRGKPCSWYIGRIEQWTITLALGRAKYIFRKRKRKNVAINESTIIGKLAAPDDEHYRSNLYQAIVDCMSLVLDDCQRDLISNAFLVSDTEKKSNTFMGEKYGCDRTTIPTRIDKALKLLAPCLESKGVKGELL